MDIGSEVPKKIVDATLGWLLAVFIRLPSGESTQEKNHTPLIPHGRHAHIGRMQGMQAHTQPTRKGVEVKTKK